MHTLRNLVLMTMLALGTAQGGVIGLTFDQPDQTGIAGDTLHFFGLIAPIWVSVAVGAVNLVLVIWLLPEPEKRVHAARPPATASPSSTRFDAIPATA